MAGSTRVTVRVVFDDTRKAESAILRAVGDAVERAAFGVEAKSKSLAPVRTGTLRRSIHTVLAHDRMRAVVGPSVDYAAPVEFGTRHMAARPYMRPAAAAVLPRFADVLRSILGRWR